MIQLTDVLKAWGTPAFAETLRGSVEQLDANLLPLQECLTQSTFTTGANRKVEVLDVSDDTDFIHAKTGIFYSGLVAGNSCDDELSPITDVSEYCEVAIDIDKRTAEAKVKLFSC
ncbi:MAG: hypothetical protein ABFE02_12700 [Sulfuricella sp.]